MADCAQLKLISKARLKSAEVLMKAEDWDGATYMMGYVLECSLKSCVCKSLRLSKYPESRKTDSHFMTHNFDQLVVLSGMSDIFNISIVPTDIFQNWSDFTKEFPGDWPAMRYDINRQQLFNDIKTKKLYNCLTDKPNGILSVIKNKKRW